MDSLTGVSAARCPNAAPFAHVKSKLTRYACLSCSPLTLAPGLSGNVAFQPISGAERLVAVPSHDRVISNRRRSFPATCSRHVLREMVVGLAHVARARIALHGNAFESFVQGPQGLCSWAETKKRAEARFLVPVLRKGSQ